MSVDSYRRQRLKTMSGTRREAMGRLWEMAREAAATRSRVGVNRLEYETDLIPGTARVVLTADLYGVTLEVYGAEWADVVTQYGPPLPDPACYYLDEAWLLTRTPEA